MTDKEEPLQKGGAQDFTWHDGRKVEVTARRCIGCAARDLAIRDFERLHEGTKPQPRVSAPGDGLNWQVDVLREEAVTSGD